MLPLGLVGKVIASVETTDDGAYFMQVPQGDYTLKARKEGFKEFIKDVKLLQAATEVLDIELVPEGESDGGRGGGKPEPTPGEKPKLKDAPPGLKLLLLKLLRPKPEPEGKPPKDGGTEKEEKPPKK